MRTPAGSECSHYFEDFHRGRSRQACRLIGANPVGRPWTPDLCRTCPVPGIERANACPNLILRGRVNPGFLGLNRKVEVGAECVLSQASVPEPQVGCGRCHEAFEAGLPPAVSRFAP